MPAASRPIRPTRKPAPASPAMPRWCWWCSIPKVVSYADLLKIFWESARPDAGHAPGQRCRHHLPLGDLHDRRASSCGSCRLARRLPGGADGGRTRQTITTEIAPAPDLLLRRGRSPAVSGEEPVRLLRPARHRRRLRDRRRPHCLAIARQPGQLAGRASFRACAGLCGIVFQKVKIPREFCFWPCKIARMSGGSKPLPCAATRRAAGSCEASVQKTTDRVWIT